VRLDHLWVVDVRNFPAAELSLPPGLLAVVGDNGAGKTNLLEAIAWLATLESFRGAPAEAVVRAGCARAVVRGEGSRAGRSLLVEVEIVPGRRGRVAVNRQPLRRAHDLASAFRVTVFSPDDLALVKGGPSGRRRYLDDALGALHPRHEAARRDYERVLRQRNALLGQVGGRGDRLAGDTATTLDVWDARLAQAGEALGAARAELVERLAPEVAKAYTQIGERSGGGGGEATIAYHAAWRDGGLAAAVAASRADDLRRGVSLVGPHRDDLVLSLGGMPARTHASQGEQRTLALALRLAVHHVAAEAMGEPPVLLLDDVFSELDAAHGRALLEHLPPGQAVLTTAGPVPTGAAPERVVRVAGGRIEAVV
jgi:DNA replication and repair protein RecF